MNSSESSCSRAWTLAILGPCNAALRLGTLTGICGEKIKGEGGAESVLAQRRTPLVVNYWSSATVRSRELLSRSLGGRQKRCLSTRDQILGAPTVNAAVSGQRVCAIQILNTSRARWMRQNPWRQQPRAHAPWSTAGQDRRLVPCESTSKPSSPQHLFSAWRSSAGPK